nr:hypothetical protein OG409_35755 [Streptomyces sp. NBC_00974]
MAREIIQKPPGRVDTARRPLLEECLQWEDLYPFPFHPGPGGLIRWGHDEHSSEYYFLAGDPDPGNWEIVVGSECAQWYRTSGSFTDFLIRCFDGLDRAPFMDRAWLGGDARYEPFDM